MQDLQRRFNNMQSDLDELRAWRDRVRSHEAASVSAKALKENGWDGLTVCVFNVDAAGRAESWQGFKRELTKAVGVGIEAITQVETLGEAKSDESGVLKQGLKVTFVEQKAARKVLVAKAMLRNGPQKWRVCEYLPVALKPIRDERIKMVKELRKIDGDSTWYDVRGVDVYVKVNLPQNEEPSKFVKVTDYAALVERVQKHHA